MRIALRWIAVIGLLGAAGPALADYDLVVKKNCLACHQVDKRKYGPNFKDSRSQVRRPEERGRRPCQEDQAWWNRRLGPGRDASAAPGIGRRGTHVGDVRAVVEVILSGPPRGPVRAEAARYPWGDDECTLVATLLCSPLPSAPSRALARASFTSSLASPRVQRRPRPLPAPRQRCSVVPPYPGASA